MLFQAYFTTIITFLGFPSFNPQQEPLQYGGIPAPSVPEVLTFVPPGAAESPEDVPFRCDYSAMARDYIYNPSPNNRGVWLKHKSDPSLDFDIFTDYEDRTPIGIERKYFLTVDEKNLNLDGVEAPLGKVLNNMYPGPWIQACWGDTLNITVKNNLRYNGTAIHMHGLRQLNTNIMDGVPGVTQCPIAPGDSFSYVFNTTQYGTTWYHSHYSHQYSDGVRGPITIHGPTSYNFTDAIDPILISDHNHRSAFQDYYQEQFANAAENRVPPKQTSIILNGHGSYAGSFPERRYTKHVQPGKRYILRLINGSTDTTFIFSIDGHILRVIGTDLVPVVPYTTDHIQIGIGQRYHVVLETNATHPPSLKTGYWIRAEPADGCHNFETYPDTRQGILWYGPGNHAPIPTTNSFQYNNTCSDELTAVPIVNWTIPPPSTMTMVEYSLPLAAVEISQKTLPAEGTDPAVTVDSWQILEEPLTVDYERPTVKFLTPPYDNDSVMYPAQPRDMWNYLLIIGGAQENPSPVTGGALLPVAHPIHLHGHDFAVLQYSTEPYDGPESINLELENPRRRDAVLLPLDGFIVIAFKSDNPGSWILHCHIAWHSSAGLAFQLLSDRDVLEDQIQEDVWADSQLNRTCRNWERWFADDRNHWSPTGRFQDDSGI
ncbi:multicopper oxidase [Aspergillus heteromorphus CBS 117.55]|uniref:Multicopper oxidase n=1 Tax=Aspergillus heteromorphus CBS 117.55 TaxID=1448321 RepID=A0A317WRZ4_9EURO|nr:multicopper oxidase [Aspergillus heteromorphus CBS 117.55]PWY89169.1 multicopper oxidase [Aspergillus heteromorphus CBS 117.55]